MDDEDINWMEALDWTEEQLNELRNAGYAYIRQGKYEVALPFFEALVILNPLSSYDAQTLGALYLEKGDATSAREILEQALKLDANHSPTLLNLAKAFFLDGKRNEGLRLANILSHDANANIANTAKALILAYS